MIFFLCVINIIFAIVFCVINVDYIYSFEVAFIGTIAAIYSSYKSISRKINIAIKDSHTNIPVESNNQSNIIDSSLESNDKSNNTQDSNDNLSKKERFFIGARISFGIFRLISYAFIAIGCIALINNKVFFIIPFFLGVLVASISSALAMMFKA